MESQPQNPEFRKNPENFHPCVVRFTYSQLHKITFHLHKIRCCVTFARALEYNINLISHFLKLQGITRESIKLMDAPQINTCSKRAAS